MPRVVFLSILLIFLFGAGAWAAEVRLEAVKTQESPGQSRLVLDFDSLPPFRVEASGQRVDLMLPGTTVASAWQGQPESGRIIRVLFAQRRGELIVSFLLRQPPARILTSTESSRRLVIDLLWQQPPTRTAVAFQVPGLPTRHENQASASVKLVSKYSGDWDRFFREYRTPLVLDVPLRFSLPPLPSVDETSVYRECQTLAMAGNPYQAGIRLHEFVAGLVADHPLLPYCRLLQAEIALATREAGDAAALLESTATTWPAAMESLRRARLGVALAKNGDADAAFKIFRSLGAPQTALAGQPCAMETAAALYYAKGEYSTAADLYRELAETIDDPAQQALAHFAWATAIDQAGANDLAIARLRQLKETFPAFEAGHRAWLKLLDQKASQGREAEYPALLSGYTILAEQGLLRELREEAAFKQALVMARTGQQERSVRLLQDFLRNFRHTGLGGEAEALLVELLPSVIRDLLGKGEHLQAVVLVEQNRQLLISGDLGPTFLLDLAGIFTRLGLAERAGRIYLFMLEAPGKKADKEALYLPLAQVYWQGKDYLQVAEYAGRYLRQYPAGEDRAPVFLLYLRALRESGRFSEAAELVTAEKVPWDREVELEAARILTAIGDFHRLSQLAGGSKGKWASAPETLLLQAEALRQTGRIEQALEIFRGLMEGDSFTDHATFRYAQIRLAQGEEKEALKILTRLVDSGRNKLWRRLAEETLRAAVL